MKGLYGLLLIIEDSDTTIYQLDLYLKAIEEIQLALKLWGQTQPPVQTPQQAKPTPE